MLIFSLFSTDVFCADFPPQPPDNGGLSNWPAGQTPPIPFGTAVTYSCDLGRNMLRNGNVSLDERTTQTITCDWDGNWNPASVFNCFLRSLARFFFIPADAGAPSIRKVQNAFLTDNFSYLEPQTSSIGEFYLVQKRRSTDFDALAT